MMLWLWQNAALRAVPICPLLALGLHSSQGSSRAPCPCPRGVWGLCMCRQIQALQAKVISRLLEVERLAWKVFQLYHLSQASQVQPLGYGASFLFSTLSTDQLQFASSAVSLCGGLQGSSSSPPSTSHCHDAIGCLKRATLLQQADLSACCQQCLPSCCIPDSSAKAPYAFSGHH